MSFIFEKGNPVPALAARNSISNAMFYLEVRGGRYLVVTFIGTLRTAKNVRAIRSIDNITKKYLNKLEAYAVSIDPEDENRGLYKQYSPNTHYFWDFDFENSRNFYALGEVNKETNEITYRSYTLVLDPFLRVISSIPLIDEAAHHNQLEAVLSSLPAVDDYAGVPLNAPVLVLPNVFEPEFCRKLIGLYQQNGGQESGFMRERDGITYGVINPSVKSRKDYNIEQEEVRAEIRKRIVKRLIPQIKKAFQFNVSRMERYMVACYDAESKGFFNVHRDNTTKGTAHRRFAVTINLNTEEYEGGDLNFPEFGSRTYRAPTGGAVVFSCSLLHQALPVTKGLRYACLPFLYDEEAAKIRQENMQYLSPEVEDTRNNA